MKPSEINTRIDFMSSVWRNFEKETIARNIVIIMQHGGSWQTFTWTEYQEKCEHNVTTLEKYILDEFVEDGYLDKKGDHYMTNDKFYRAVASYFGEKK